METSGMNHMSQFPRRSSEFINQMSQFTRRNSEVCFALFFDLLTNTPSGYTKLNQR